VHRHVQEFSAANAFAAEDADDRVVAGRLEIPRPAAAGDLKQLLDEVGRERLRAPLYWRVPVQSVAAVRAREAALVL
jgi:hypothetical protein